MKRLISFKRVFDDALWLFLLWENDDYNLAFLLNSRLSKNIEIGSTGISNQESRFRITCRTIPFSQMHCIQLWCECCWFQLGGARRRWRGVTFSNFIFYAKRFARIKRISLLFKFKFYALFGGKFKLLTSILFCLIDFFLLFFLTRMSMRYDVWVRRVYHSGFNSNFQIIGKI